MGHNDTAWTSGDKLDLTETPGLKFYFLLKSFLAIFFLPYLHLYSFVVKFLLGTDSEQVEYKPLPGGPSSGTQKETEKEMEQEVIT